MFHAIKEITFVELKRAVKADSPLQLKINIQIRFNACFQNRIIL